MSVSRYSLFDESSMITAAQLRAARGLLDWTRSDLAKAANVSPETIKNIEHGTFRPQETTAEAIVNAFATNGVEFVDGEGVRKTKDSVVRYEGIDGFKKFMDAIYEAAKMPFSLEGGDKPLYATNFRDSIFSKHLGDYAELHVNRMNEIAGLKVKILMQTDYDTDKPMNRFKTCKYRELRIPSAKYNGEAPFYVYGDNLGFLITDENSAQIIVVSSAPVAKSYRQHFETLWQYAKPETEV